MSQQFWEKKRQIFALFKSIFLRNQFLSNTRCFYGKKHKTGKGNLYLTENWLSGNEMWCAADNPNYMCHIYADMPTSGNTNLYFEAHKPVFFNKNLYFLKNIHKQASFTSFYNSHLYNQHCNTFYASLETSLLLCQRNYPKM